MLAIERVYLGRDNSIDVVLTANGAPVDLSSVTRMLIEFGSKAVDSQTASGVFDWSSGGGVVIIRLGGQEIAAGEYSARLVVYDPTNTHGIVWGDIMIMVEQG